MTYRDNSKHIEIRMNSMTIAISIAVLLLVVWIVSFVVRANSAANFILEVYTSILSFEWKPSEEIGLRIEKSTHPAIRNFIDKHYAEMKSGMTREKFTKLFTVGMIDAMVQFGYAESQRARVSEEWCVQNKYLITELTPEEIEWHMKRPRIEIPAFGNKADQEEIELILGKMNELADRVFEEGLFDLVLCKKKPGGKRPPKLNRKAAKNVFDNMQPVGALLQAKNGV